MSEIIIFVYFPIKIAIFTSAVYKLFEVFYQFINEERIKSSTRTMNKVIDEWEQVFANDVNRLLLKCFMRFIQEKGMLGFCFGS